MRVRDLVSAVLWSLALGLGARIVMRIIAVDAGLPGSFSIGGSLEVVALGVLIGLPTALVVQLLRPRLHLPWLGALAGALLFLMLAVRPTAAARSALAATPDAPVRTAILFAVLLVGFGAGLDWSSHRHARRR